MGRKVAQERASKVIVELAARQHGVVSARQLRSNGVTEDQYLGRLDAGWIHRLHRGVYAVGGHALSWRGRWMGAVLACGDGALLSHRAAAALWRLARPQPGPIDVTVPGRAGRRPPAGITIHRSTTLTPEDLSERDRIPVTSPARTIIDLARAGMCRRPLERLLDEADRHRLLDMPAFNAAVRPGARRLPKSLRDLLDSHEPGSTLTRSDLEELFLSLCRDHALPQPLVNASLLGITVDFLWPGAGLVVEVDGRGSHDTRRGFEDDHDRDSMLVAAGFRTMRFTWWDVTRRPGVVAHRLRRALNG